MDSRGKAQSDSILPVVAFAMLVAGTLFFLSSNTDRQPRNAQPNNPRNVSVGKVVKGQSAKGRFLLYNDTGGSISILQIDSDCGCLSITTGDEKPIVRPRQLFPIDFLIDTGKIASSTIQRNIAIQYTDENKSVSSEIRYLSVAVTGEMSPGTNINVIPGDIHFSSAVKGEHQNAVFFGDEALVRQLPDRIDVRPDVLTQIVTVDKTKLAFKPSYKIVSVIPALATSPYRIELSINMCNPPCC